MESPNHIWIPRLFFSNGWKSNSYKGNFPITPGRHSLQTQPMQPFGCNFTAVSTDYSCNYISCPLRMPS